MLSHIECPPWWLWTQVINTTKNMSAVWRTSPVNCVLFYWGYHWKRQIVFTTSTVLHILTLSLWKFLNCRYSMMEGVMEDEWCGWSEVCDVGGKLYVLTVCSCEVWWLPGCDCNGEYWLFLPCKITNRSFWTQPDMSWQNCEKNEQHQPPRCHVSLAFACSSM